MCLYGVCSLDNHLTTHQKVTNKHPHPLGNHTCKSWYSLRQRWKYEDIYLWKDGRYGYGGRYNEYREKRM